MTATFLIITMSVLLFSTIIRIGSSLITTMIKAFEGIVALVLLGFMMAVWSDPGGTGLFFRKAFILLTDLIKSFSFLSHG